MFTKLSLRYIPDIEFSTDCRHLENLGPEDLRDSNNSTLIEAQKAEAVDAILTKKRPWTYTKWISDEVGYGLFADSDIDDSKFVIVYAGIVGKVSNSGKIFTWNYPSSGNIAGSTYSISGNFNSNEARFVNDNPKDRSKVNLRPEMIYVPVANGRGYYVIVYFTSRKIAKNEELLISYGDSCWTKRQSVAL